MPADEVARGLEWRPTAVYAFNDEIALGARDLLPDGVALIGTDDSPAARLAHPRLTTIQLGTVDDWKRVARALHTQIEDEDAVVASVVVTPKVVPGQTT